MRFKVTKRMGKFLNLNTRSENHGPEKIPAADLTVEFKGSKRDLDMLVPLADKRKFSETVYDEHKHLQVPFLNPLKVSRTPENVTATIWDQATKPKSPLKFEGCKVKNIVAIMHDKLNLDIKLLIQLHDDPERDTARLRRLCDGEEREFELIAQQDDFFDEDPEDGDDDDKDKDNGGQQELGVDDDEEDDDDSDEDDEDTDDEDDDDDE